MLEEYFIAGATGVIVAAAVVLAMLLSRYRMMVREADESTRLAKDVWESMNSRFSVVDARIIDLMAKTDVLSSRLGTPQQKVALQARPAPNVTMESVKAVDVSKIVTKVAASEGTETEAKVLRLLVEGPKTSAQIKEVLGRSREHTARLMKAMFDRGLVVRNDRNKPYVYEITDTGRSYAAS